MERRRTLTIEDMIKQGASWSEIIARIGDLQKVEAERKAAAEKAEREKAKKAKSIEVARQRFIAAFADWMIATGVLPEQEKEEFCAVVSEELEEMLLLTPFFMR
jgi:hypothetical protein